jgi:DNA polymerase III alpha subunit
MTGVTVEGIVVKVEPTRKVANKKVAHALLEDESGAVKLVLWEKQINEVAQGSKIRIDGAYVKTWSDERQLHAGRTGVISLVEESTDSTSYTTISQPRHRGAIKWISQNPNKTYANGSLSWWAEQAREGHVIEWEMDESGYTGKVRLDGEIMLKQAARRKLNRM